MFPVAGFNVEAKQEEPDDKKEVKKASVLRRETSAKYRCKVCGYVYDSEKGDTDNGIKPGAPFHDLPEDWVCPECGVNKDQFEEMGE